MQRLLITGSQGFLGKHLTAHFTKHYHILAPVRTTLDLCNADAVQDYLQQHQPIDCVINCASVGVSRASQRSSAECLSENLHSFGNIYQHSKACQRFIQLGSGAEYSKPFAHGEIMEEECGAIIPADAYGMAKFYAGQTIENLATPGQAVNVRLFGVFGSHEDYYTRFISNSIVRSLLDLPIVVKQNAIFDYVYVDDVVKIIAYFLEHAAPQLSYNVTTAQHYSLIELAKIVKDVTANRHDIVVNNDQLKETYTGSNARLMKFLPPQFQFTPIKTAITALAKWYEMYISTRRDSIDQNRL